MAQATKTKKIFDGRYELIGIVGRGSHSVVYHARHTFVPSSQVALKVLIAPQKKSQDGDNLNDKLRKEALAMVSARHKYVIRIDDFHSIENLCYLSMEFAAEGDLRKFTQTFGGKLPAPLAERFLKQAAEALQFIHRAGMIHRDIKPDNILVMNENEIRIADFGVAVLPHEKFSIQELQAGVGTMDYMAPEVLQGIEYKQAADIYALGVTFYELISGVHPFKDASMLQQLEARKSENLKALDQIIPGLPKLLSQTIMKAMQYNPADRFESGKALLDFLNGKAPETVQKPATAAVTGTAPSQPKPEALAKENAPSSQRPLEPRPSAAEILAKGSSAPKAPVAPEEKPEKLSAASILKRLEALKEQQQQGAPPKTTPQAVQPLQQAVSPAEIKPPTDPKPSATASASAISAGMSSPTPREPERPAPKFEIPAQAAPKAAIQPAASPQTPPPPSQQPKPPPGPIAEAPIREAKSSQPMTGASKALFAETNEEESPEEIFEAQLRKIKEKSQTLKADKEKIVKKAFKQDKRSAVNLGNLAGIVRRLGAKRLLIVAAVVIAFFWLNSGSTPPSPATTQTAEVLESNTGEQALTPPDDLSSPGEQGVVESTEPPQQQAATGLTFPILPSGFYYGKINNIFGSESLPLALISFAERKKVALVVGRDGWSPDVVSIEGLEVGRELRVSSNGTMLELNATQSDKERIIGTVRSVTGQTSGTWELRKR